VPLADTYALQGSTIRFLPLSAFNLGWHFNFTVKFVALNTLHQNDKNSDTIIHVRSEDIRQVIAAVENERKMRKELNTFVVTCNGTFATPHTLDEVLDKIRELEQ